MSVVARNSSPASSTDRTDSRAPFVSTSLRKTDRGFETRASSVLSSNPRTRSRGTITSWPAASNFNAPSAGQATIVPAEVSPLVSKTKSSRRFSGGRLTVSSVGHTAASAESGSVISCSIPRSALKRTLSPAIDTNRPGIRSPLASKTCGRSCGRFGGAWPARRMLTTSLPATAGAVPTWAVPSAVRRTNGPVAGSPRTLCISNSGASTAAQQAAGSRQQTARNKTPVLVRLLPATCCLL